MTLTELLITMLILIVIIGPLTGAMIVYLRNTQATSDRLSESHDAQIAAAYFRDDVQNTGLRDWVHPPYTGYVQSITMDAPVNQGPYGCGSDTTTALIQFAWTEPAATIATQSERSATYVVRPVTGSPGVGELHRVTCQKAPDSSGGAVTMLADIIVAHNVDLSALPTVTCVDGSGNFTKAACTASTTPPGTVKLTLSVRAQGRPSDYPVVLIGERRQT
jgi:hypothetical protein